MNLLQLPHRTEKPRQHGLTAIADLGLTVPELRNVLEAYAPLVDIAKFGIGSAYLTPGIDEKIAIYREHGVISYFGGALFEKFYQQKKVPAYLKYLRAHNIEWIEISNGAIEFPLEKRVSLIKEICGEFKVIAEVGCKETDFVMPASQWVAELSTALEAGSSYVITEGRDAATAGILRESGEVSDDLLGDILKFIDPKRTIFEAPTSKTQMFFINLVGANVNLGNVAPHDLLILESQRQSLRYETFFNKKE